MADTLKEIYNADAYLNSFTGTTKPIITTNSTTQYAIKDIQVGTNTIPGTISILNNNVPCVTGLSTSVSGSEIVDYNSTVSLSIPATPVYTKSSVSAMTNGYVNAGSTYIDGYTYSVAIGNNTSSTYGGTVNPGLTSAFTQASGYYVVEHWVVGSDVYYWTFNNNDGWEFYKRTGGFNGTQTLLKNSTNGGTITQNPGNYGWVLYSASANKFYLIGSNAIVVTYDPTNNTSTSVAINTGAGFSSTSSYLRATLSNNGLICLLSSWNNSANIWAINPTNGHNINFQSLYDWNNQANGVQSDLKLFVYFSGTQYYIWRTNGMNSLNQWYLTITNSSTPPTFPTSTTTYYSTYATNTYFGSIGFGSAVANANNAGYLPDTYGSNNATYVYLGTASSTSPVVRTFNMVTGAVTAVTLSNTNISSPYGFKGFVAPTSSTAGDIANTTYYPHLIRLRVAGVQVTP